MLSLTWRHSRPGASPHALSRLLQLRQVAHIHSNPSIAASKSTAKASVESPLAKGWREKTVVELKVELKQRGLPITGKKEEVF